MKRTFTRESFLNEDNAPYCRTYKVSHGKDFFSCNVTPELSPSEESKIWETLEGQLELFLTLKGNDGMIACNFFSYTIYE
jgi:hypothetical protein